MAILSPEALKELWATYMREQSDKRQSTPLNKFELLDTLTSVDEQLDSFLTSLRENITIKAQLSLSDAQWLRMVELCLSARHLEDVRTGKDGISDIPAEVKV